MLSDPRDLENLGFPESVSGTGGVNKPDSQKIEEVTAGLQNLDAKRTCSTFDITKFRSGH